MNEQELVEMGKIIEWIVENPIHVIFCEADQLTSSYPKGISFDPYLKYESKYALMPTKDMGYFSMGKTGMRTRQGLNSYPIAKWKQFILRSAAGRTIPGFVLEKINRERVAAIDKKG
jgi:hypothetical protein